MSSSLAGNPEFARLYLKRVFDDARGYVAMAAGFGGYFAAAGGSYSFPEGAFREDFYSWPDEVDRIVERAMEYAPKADIYVCPVPRSKRSRRKGDGVPARHLFADLDKFGPELVGFDRVLIGPTGFLIDSGGPDQGVHVYLALDEPLAPEEIERWNQRLAARLGADSGWSETKYLRLPGTFNHKGRALGENSRLVEFLPFEPAPKDWALDELAELLPEVAISSGNGAVPLIPAPAPERLPRHIADRLREPPAGDRSVQAHGLVASCIEWGLSDGETLSLALGHAPTIEKFGDRAAAEIERSVAKLRPEHNHVGRPCDKAGCPNAPTWMHGSPVVTPPETVRRDLSGVPHGTPEDEPSETDPLDRPDDEDGLTVDDILAAKALLAGKASQASEVARLVRESGALLFHGADGRAYASFETRGHTETASIRSRDFKLFARYLYHRAKDASPTGTALADGLATLESEALFDGPEVDVHLRLAGNDGAIYLDLGDPDWRAITITPSGWSVGEHPIRFRRARGMAALPEPVRGGSLDDLRPFLNVASEDDWRLLVAWEIAAARPPGRPYPVAVLHGEQGSAKSTTARLLRELVDPSTVPLRAAPRELRDLMISAQSSWVVSFDNLSHLQPWLSDALCRLATGGGFATRELYTDDDEIILEAQRPVLINGIEELATRSDLLDRALLLHLPTIAKDTRRAEDAFWREFYEARPAILGALCDTISAALANVSTTTLERLPRMADFALWVTAAEESLGWEQCSFLACYEANRDQAHELAVDASVVGPALIVIAEEGFEGTASELLALLVTRVDEKVARSSEWPRNGRALSGTVKRLAPNLRALGYDVEQGHRESGTRRRLITLRKKPL